MNCAGRISLLTAGLLVVAAALPAAVIAQTPPPHSRNVDTLPLAPGFEKPEDIKPRDEKDSKLELPTQFDLGNSKLRLDTNRKEIDPIPRVGIDAADPKVLNPNLPQEKESPLKPGYFGFTISTPTH
jgi:hypothetical protein